MEFYFKWRDLLKLLIVPRRARGAPEPNGPPRPLQRPHQLLPLSISLPLRLRVRTALEATEWMVGHIILAIGQDCSLKHLLPDGHALQSLMVQRLKLPMQIVEYPLLILVKLDRLMLNH